MALHCQLSSFPTTTFITRFPPSTIRPTSVEYLSSIANRPLSVGQLGSCRIACEATEKTNQVTRRSATYQKHAWDYDSILSLKSIYLGEPYTRRANELKDEARMILEKVLKPLDQLELIDVLQRLGLANHFEDEIKSILTCIYHVNYLEDTRTRDDLYATSLAFRLLRQHRYNVPQDVFNSFKDKQGNFRSSLCDDLNGMLNLYEASCHSVEGESTLDDARHFTTEFLEKYAKQCKSSDYLSMLVRHALEAPLDWRVPRFEARWFINVYETKQDREPILLELAKLDFNMVQAIHQEDLKQHVRWWKKTGLEEKFPFLRAWPVECFFFAVGFVSEPEFGACRKVFAKFNQLTAMLDDIFDAYGALDEIRLFTDAVERWDINTMDQLSDYMKLYFLALYNFTNKIAFDVLKHRGIHILPYIKKAWAVLCKAFLVEAEWYHAGYTPTLQEYLDNGWISAAVPPLLVYAYFYVPNPTTTEALHCLDKSTDMIRCLSIVARLADDLGSFLSELERGGDSPKSIQCYMHDTGASKEEACEHLRSLIIELWKKIHKDRSSNPAFSEAFVEVAVNATRTMQFLFQNVSEYESVLRRTKDAITSMLIQPIPLQDHDTKGGQTDKMARV